MEFADFFPYMDESDHVKNQLSPFVTSSQTTVKSALEFIKLNESDSLIDLGCGDGRVVFEAVEKYNCKGIGIDISEQLIQECKKLAQEKNLQNASFFVDDFSRQNFDFYGCSCICFYLTPKVMKIIKNKLFDY